jgi:hypothetical protein
MDTLARETIASSIYYLGNNPIEVTIEVTVNGVSMTTGWEYDEILNAVVFDTAPAEKSITDVTYAMWGDCGNKKAIAGDTGI